MRTTITRTGTRTRTRTGPSAGVLALVLGAAMTAQAAAPNVGDKAPDFSLPDQNNKQIKLSDFLGKKNVVLAFYVLAFTGG